MYCSIRIWIFVTWTINQGNNTKKSIFIIILLISIGYDNWEAYFTNLAVVRKVTRVK